MTHIKNSKWSIGNMQDGIDELIERKATATGTDKITTNLNQHLINAYDTWFNQEMREDVDIEKLVAASLNGVITTLGTFILYVEPDKRAEIIKEIKNILVNSYGIIEEALSEYKED